MIESYVTLDNVKEGTIVKVKKMSSSGTMRRRLQDIGLIEGTNVECLLKSPSGDPTAYLIRGAVIALRAEDSSNIEIEEIFC